MDIHKYIHYYCFFLILKTDHSNFFWNPSQRKKSEMQSAQLLNISSLCLRSLLQKNNPALASTPIFSNRDLNQDPNFEEIMQYCESLPYSIGMFSFQDHTYGIACLCLRSSSPYYYEQTFIVFDSFNYYSNDPVSVSRKSKAHKMKTIIPIYFPIQQQQLEGADLPLEVLQHPQVDLVTRYRIIKQRFHDTGDDVAKVAVIKHLQQLYCQYQQQQHYHDSCATSPVGIISMHAYLSFQCRALNLYPSPPRRVYYWNQDIGNITEQNRETEEAVQSLADIRRDIPILFGAIMREVAKFSEKEQQLLRGKSDDSYLQTGYAALTFNLVTRRKRTTCVKSINMKN